MYRTITAIVLSSIAAPQLGWLLFLLTQPEFWDSGIFPALIVGIGLTIFYGLPVLAISAIIAWLTTQFGVTARFAFCLIGAVVGIGFSIGLILTVPDSGLALPKDWPACLAGILSGSICGWIYWRIAVYGRDLKPVT